MKKNNLYQERAKATFRAVKRLLKDQPKIQREIDDGLEDMDKADYLYGKLIEDAKMIGVRNPAFDGDYIGWLDDDVETDEDDDKPQKGE